MPRTEPSLQINISFFLETNDWIFYITKSHFRRVERIADNLGSYHGITGINLIGFFPNAQQLIGFLLQPIALH